MGKEAVVVMPSVVPERDALIPAPGQSLPPFELIFLDVGSLDGTAEYLAGIAAAAPVPVEVVRAATDLDIGRACAEALRRARGEFLVLLNNDTLVPPAWLQ